MVEELVARDGKGMRKGRGGRGKGKGGGVLTCAPCRSRAVRSGCSWRPAVPRAAEAQGSLPRGCAPPYMRHTRALRRCAQRRCLGLTGAGVSERASLARPLKNLMSRALSTRWSEEQGFAVNIA